MRTSSTGCAASKTGELIDAPNHRNPLNLDSQFGSIIVDTANDLVAVSQSFDFPNYDLCGHASADQHHFLAGCRGTAYRIRSRTREKNRTPASRPMLSTASRM